MPRCWCSLRVAVHYAGGHFECDAVSAVYECFECIYF